MNFSIARAQGPPEVGTKAKSDDPTSSGDSTTLGRWPRLLRGWPTKVELAKASARPADPVPSGRSTPPIEGSEASAKAEVDAPEGLPPLPTASTMKADPTVKPAQFAEFGGFSYINTGDVSIGSQADLRFTRRLWKAYVDKPDPPGPEDPAAPPTRRGLPAPFQAPPLPYSDFIGPTIGVNDTSVFPLMEALYKGPNGQAWKDSRLKIYGWFDPSVTFGTSKMSNIPLAYNIVPNKLELSQLILIFERPVDTAQQDHFDWGFRTTNLYGIDYRYTTAKGYFSNQLLKHNHLYGYDPLQLYMDFYFPHVAQGLVVRAGRYISPIDIEAQLSPDNFLYTHSVMYAYDPYTFTGIQTITKLSDRWHVQIGAHAGNDMAPWTTSSQANGEFLLKWVSKSNKDSLYGGVDSIGRGYYQKGHDDLQVAALTWSHKFNDNFNTTTESYYIWQRQALAGGTVTNGNPHPYFPGVGPGKLIPGLSDAFGIVNHTSYKLNDKALIVLRGDILADFQGQRTGISTTYFEHTLGYIYHINSWAIFRPEVRLDYTSGAKAYDNATKRDQFTFSADLIFRF